MTSCCFYITVRDKIIENLSHSRYLAVTFLKAHIINTPWLTHEGERWDVSWWAYILTMFGPCPCWSLVWNIIFYQSAIYRESPGLLLSTLKQLSHFLPSKWLRLNFVSGAVTVNVKFQYGIGLVQQFLARHCGCWWHGDLVPGHQQPQCWLHTLAFPADYGST